MSKSRRKIVLKTKTADGLQCRNFGLSAVTAHAIQRQAEKFGVAISGGEAITVASDLATVGHSRVRNSTWQARKVQ